MSYFTSGNVVFLENKDVNAKGEIPIKDKPVFVMIFGSFCGHCKVSAPEFEKLAQAMKARNVLLGAIQVDGSPSEQELAKRLSSFIPNMVGVPTFVLFEKGVITDIYEGDRTAQAMVRYLVQKTNKL